MITEATPPLVAEVRWALIKTGHIEPVGALGRCPGPTVHPVVTDLIRELLEDQVLMEIDLPVIPAEEPQDIVVLGRERQEAVVTILDVITAALVEVREVTEALEAAQDQVRAVIEVRVEVPEVLEVTGALEEVLGPLGLLEGHRLEEVADVNKENQADTILFVVKNLSLRHLKRTENITKVM